jgi:hypothetical protein
MYNSNNIKKDLSLDNLQKNEIINNNKYIE